MSLDPLMLLVGLWLAGVAGAILIMARLQHGFMSQARGGAAGPAVVGVIAPRIVTPKGFTERYSQGEQVLVLAHEQAHIARQDSRLNGLCAAAQCLCWFNPLVHLAAHLMRIDQELACDETVMTRFPDARRAYAEVLVKAQLATLPLPLGCYWPSTSEHPLVERVAMLKRKGVSRARRFAGAAALTVLCVGAALTAWASQPADVRIAISPPDEVQRAQARAIASTPERTGAGDHHGAPTPDADAIAPKPVKTVAGNGPPDQTPSEAAAPAITVAQAETTLTPDRAIAGDGDFPPSAQAIASPQAVRTPLGPVAEDAVPTQLAKLQGRQPGDEGGSPTARQAARRPAPLTARIAAAPAIIKIFQDTGMADNPEQTVCKVEAVTGSRFVRRICMTRSQWKEQQFRLFALERFWLLDPSGYPAADY